MKKHLLTGVIVLVLALSLVPSVSAANAPSPVGPCPVGFELHEFDHHGDGDHSHHIGLAEDLNGNGFICVKFLANGLHVHKDDVIR